MAQLSPSFLGDKAPLGIAMVSKSVRESVISKKLETTSVQSVANVPSVSSLSSVSSVGQMENNANPTYLNLSLANLNATSTEVRQVPRICTAQYIQLDMCTVAYKRLNI